MTGARDAAKSRLKTLHDYFSRFPVFADLLEDHVRSKFINQSLYLSAFVVVLSFLFYAVLQDPSAFYGKQEASKIIIYGNPFQSIATLGRPVRTINPDETMIVRVVNTQGLGVPQKRVAINAVIRHGSLKHSYAYFPGSYAFGSLCSWTSAVDYIDRLRFERVCQALVEPGFLVTDDDGTIEIGAFSVSSAFEGLFDIYFAVDGVASDPFSVSFHSPVQRIVLRTIPYQDATEQDADDDWTQLASAISNLPASLLLGSAVPDDQLPFVCLLDSSAKPIPKTRVVLYSYAPSPAPGINLVDSVLLEEQPSQLQIVSWTPVPDEMLFLLSPGNLQRLAVFENDFGMTDETGCVKLTGLTMVSADHDRTFLGVVAGGLSSLLNPVAPISVVSQLSGADCRLVPLWSGVVLATQGVQILPALRVRLVCNASLQGVSLQGAMVSAHIHAVDQFELSFGFKPSLQSAFALPSVQLENSVAYTDEDGIASFSQLLVSDGGGFKTARLAFSCASAPTLFISADQEIHLISRVRQINFVPDGGSKFPVEVSLYSAFQVPGLFKVTDSQGSAVESLPFLVRYAAPAAPVSATDSIDVLDLDYVALAQGYRISVMVLAAELHTVYSLEVSVDEGVTWFGFPELQITVIANADVMSSNPEYVQSCSSSGRGIPVYPHMVSAGLRMNRTIHYPLDRDPHSHLLLDGWFDSCGYLTHNLSAYPTLYRFFAREFGILFSSRSQKTNELVVSAFQESWFDSGPSSDVTVFDKERSDVTFGSGVLLESFVPDRLFQALFLSNIAVPQFSSKTSGLDDLFGRSFPSSPSRWFAMKAGILEVSAVSVLSSNDGFTQNVSIRANFADGFNTSAVQKGIQCWLVTVSRPLYYDLLLSVSSDVFNNQWNGAASLLDAPAVTLHQTMDAGSSMCAFSWRCPIGSPGVYWLSPQVETVPGEPIQVNCRNRVSFNVSGDGPAEIQIGKAFSFEIAITSDAQSPVVASLFVKVFSLMHNSSYPLATESLPIRHLLPCAFQSNGLAVCTVAVLPREDVLETDVVSVQIVYAPFTESAIEQEAFRTVLANLSPSMYSMSFFGQDPADSISLIPGLTVAQPFSVCLSSDVTFLSFWFAPQVTLHAVDSSREEFSSNLRYTFVTHDNEDMRSPLLVYGSGVTRLCANFRVVITASSDQNLRMCSRYSSVNSSCLSIVLSSSVRFASLGVQSGWSYSDLYGMLPVQLSVPSFEVGDRIPIIVRALQLGSFVNASYVSKDLVLNFPNLPAPVANAKIVLYPVYCGASLFSSDLVLAAKQCASINVGDVGSIVRNGNVEFPSSSNINFTSEVTLTTYPFSVNDFSEFGTAQFTSFALTAGMQGYYSILSIVEGSLVRSLPYLIYLHNAVQSVTVGPFSGSYPSRITSAGRQTLDPPIYIFLTGEAGNSSMAGFAARIRFSVTSCHEFSKLCFVSPPTLVTPPSDDGGMIVVSDIDIPASSYGEYDVVVSVNGVQASTFSMVIQNSATVDLGSISEFKLFSLFLMVLLIPQFMANVDSSKRWLLVCGVVVSALIFVLLIVFAFKDVFYPSSLPLHAVYLDYALRWVAVLLLLGIFLGFCFRLLMSFSAKSCDATATQTSLWSSKLHVQQLLRNRSSSLGRQGNEQDWLLGKPSPVHVNAGRSHPTVLVLQLRLWMNTAKFRLSRLRKFVFPQRLWLSFLLSCFFFVLSMACMYILYLWEKFIVVSVFNYYIDRFYVLTAGSAQNTFENLFFPGSYPTSGTPTNDASGFPFLHDFILMLLGRAHDVSEFYHQVLVGLRTAFWVAASMASLFFVCCWFCIFILFECRVQNMRRGVYFFRRGVFQTAILRAPQYVGFHVSSSLVSGLLCFGTVWLLIFLLCFPAVRHWVVDYLVPLIVIYFLTNVLFLLFITFVASKFLVCGNDLRHRRIFAGYDFAMTMLGIIFGVFSAVRQLIQGLALIIFYMMRIDLCPADDSRASVMTPYSSYVGMTYAFHYLQNAVLVVFLDAISKSQNFADGYTRMPSESPRRQRIVAKYWLLITLSNNPSLCALRKHQLSQDVKHLSSTPAPLGYSTNINDSPLSNRKAELVV
eukprot:ANDGO_00329.mRNA.1 hypothetical protein